MFHAATSSTIVDASKGINADKFKAELDAATLVGV
jgi:hypothetical protein